MARDRRLHDLGTSRAAAVRADPRVRRGCQRALPAGIVRVRGSVTLVGLRIGGVTALLVAAVVGLFISGKLERDSRARIETLETTAVTLDEAQTQEQDRKVAKQFDERAFGEGAVQDATRFGIAPFEPASLAKPNRYVNALAEPVVIKPGRSWTSEHIKVGVSLDKVQYNQHGATISARHTIATFENVSKGPVAYFASVRSAERGRCDVRGARQHNAMALMPGEVAEVVVCAGTGKVRVDRLEVLEVSPLGYVYVSRVPARAVGHDGITGGSHSPMNRVQVCQTVDTKGIAGKLAQGLTRWRDVVDYYARHDCERFRFFFDYRHTDDGPARLPALPSR